MSFRLTYANAGWGRWFNDFLAETYIKAHQGHHKNENRLWGVYPAWIIGLAGLIAFGETLQYHLSCVGLAFGWGEWPSVRFAVHFIACTEQSPGPPWKEQS